MYLSKVLLPPETARKPYEWHRAIWELFPDRPDDSRDFLFRVEGRQRGPSTVLVQSQHTPQSGAGAARILASKGFEPSLKSGQVLRFRLTANPIRSIKDNKGRTNRKGEQKACRVPLTNEDAITDWLMRKFEGAAQPHELQITSRNPLFFRKGSRRGKIVQVTFDGILSVDNPDRFQALMEKGVGPAKSFGCGLLSLARL